MKIRSEIILAVAYVLLVVYVIFSGKHGKPPDQSNEYRQRIERLQWQYDSLLILERNLEAAYHRLYKSLEVQLEETKKLQNRYDKLKNRKPVDFTDSQIDSLLSRRYGSGKPIPSNKINR